MIKHKINKFTIKTKMEIVSVIYLFIIIKKLATNFGEFYYKNYYTDIYLPHVYDTYLKGR